jgi:hypothetical protein
MVDIVVVFCHDVVVVALPFLFVLLLPSLVSFSRTIPPFDFVDYESIDDWVVVAMVIACHPFVWVAVVAVALPSCCCV